MLTKGTVIRKGEWLITEIIKNNPDLQTVQMVYSVIWNMSSKEYDEIMRKYYE